MINLSYLFILASLANTPRVTIDGSSTVFPITEAVAEEFQKIHKTQVTVGISGTGGGFKKFCRGETDVQDASRPISASEMADCAQSKVQFYELPIGFDAITIVVHPKNEWLKEISIDELRKIWEPSAQGKITRWNQIRPTYPDAPIALYGAGSDSGTFDYFTEATVGKAKSSRGDYNGSEDDNALVQGLSTNPNALGYIPFSYYEANVSKLKAVPVVSAQSKKPIMPTRATVENGTYTPFSRPIFIYVSKVASQRSEVNLFVNFYLANARKLIEQVKYIPLPEPTFALVTKIFKDNALGTVFEGHSSIGGSHLKETLKRKRKVVL